MTLLTVILTSALALGTMLLPGAVAQQSQKPYSEDDVVGLLRSYVSPKRVADLARKSGISFELTPEVETRLRNAGATDELLKELRVLSPLPVAPPPRTPKIAGPLLITSAPTGAEVYLDDKLEGTTDSGGRLELSTLPPATYKVRVSLAGYADYEQNITLVPGQPTTVTALLKAVSVPPPPPAVATFRVTHKHTMGSCEGELIIGDGMLEYRSDHEASHSFKSPLSQITYAQTFVGGFYLQPADGKKRYFFSKSMVAILQLLQKLGNQH